MTLEETVEILATLEAASPAPWVWVIGARPHSDPHHDLLDARGEIVLDDGSACGEYGVSIDYKSANGKLVENAPAWLAKMYLEIERLKKVNARRAILINNLVERVKMNGSVRIGDQGAVEIDRKRNKDLVDRALQELKR